MHKALIHSQLPRTKIKPQHTDLFNFNFSNLFNFKFYLSTFVIFFKKISDFINLNFLYCLSILALFIFSLANGVHKIDRLLIFWKLILKSQTQMMLKYVKF